MLDNEFQLRTPESPLQGVFLLDHDPYIHLFILLPHWILRFHAEPTVRPSKLQKQTFFEGMEGTAAGRALEHLHRPRTPRVRLEGPGR